MECHPPKGTATASQPVKPANSDLYFYDKYNNKVSRPLPGIKFKAIASGCHLSLLYTCSSIQVLKYLFRKK